jgi:hypothetical protein
MGVKLKKDHKQKLKAYALAPTTENGEAMMADLEGRLVESHLDGAMAAAASGEAAVDAFLATIEEED